MKYKKLLYLIIPTIMLVLEALPYGVKIALVTGETGSTSELYSYFSVVPINNGIFLPMFIGCANILLIILSLIFIILSIWFPKIDVKRTYQAIKLVTLIVVIGILVQFVAFFESVALLTWLIFALGIIDMALLIKFDYNH